MNSLVLFSDEQFTVLRAWSLQTNQTHDRGQGWSALPDRLGWPRDKRDSPAISVLDQTPSPQIKRSNPPPDDNTT